MTIFDPTSDLLNTNDLMLLLGCKDNRTVMKWCKANGLQVVKLGKRKYVSASAVNTMINGRFTEQSPIRSDNILKVIKTTSSALPIDAKGKKHSKAALDYMKKFKAA